jgi:hypothetical protein
VREHKCMSIPSQNSQKIKWHSIRIYPPNTKLRCN